MGNPMGVPWDSIARGTSMVLSRDPHDTPMGLAWDLRGCPVGLPWGFKDTHEMPMKDTLDKVHHRKDYCMSIVA